MVRIPTDGDIGCTLPDEASYVSAAFIGLPAGQYRQSAPDSGRTRAFPARGSGIRPTQRFILETDKHAEIDCQHRST